MKTIQLTDEEIIIIKKALQFAYTESLNLLSKSNRILLDGECKNVIISQANKFNNVEYIFDNKINESL